MLSLFSARSFQRSGLQTEAMQEAISQLLKKNAYDIIQIESSQMAGFDYGSSAIVVLDEHNIEYELLYRMFRTEKSWMRRLYNGMEYLKFRHEEQQSWERADGCILTSVREEKLLKAHLPDKPTITAPNGVDIDYFSPSTAQPDANQIVFSGLMNYRPNIDGAQYLVREILPLLSAKHPDIHITLVGMGAGEEVYDLAGPHVTVTGEVPDVRPYVTQAAVVVVPLRMGSGTRLKVLEGLSMEKAIVSTSLGCEGISVTDGEHLLISDTPQDFADAVTRLIHDRALAVSLGKQGRTLVKEHYSWVPIIQEMEAFYQKMSGSSRQDSALPASHAHQGANKINH